MTWVAAAATIVMIIVVSVLVSVTEDDLSQSLLYLLVAAVVLGIIPFSMRSWNAPARALTGRQVEGRERDASEVRLIRLAQVSWVQLLTAVAVVPFVLLNLSGQFDIWHGWGLLGPVIASLIIVLVIVQAIRKWLLAAAN